MSDRLPQAIHPDRLAESGEILHGRLPLNSMRRLGSHLHDTEGAVEVELEFGVDVQRIRYLRSRIQTDLHLICQRCLQPFSYPVDTEVMLGVSHSDAAAKLLPEPYEPLVVEDSLVEIGKIVEDELLLALPIVPLHAKQECGASTILYEAPEEAQPDKGGTRQPFAGLDQLMKDKSK